MKRHPPSATLVKGETADTGLPVGRDNGCRSQHHRHVGGISRACNRNLESLMEITCPGNIHAYLESTAVSAEVNFGEDEPVVTGVIGVVIVSER